MIFFMDTVVSAGMFDHDLHEISKSHMQSRDPIDPKATDVSIWVKGKAFINLSVFVARVSTCILEKIRVTLFTIIISFMINLTSNLILLFQNILSGCDCETCGPGDLFIAHGVKCPNTFLQDLIHLKNSRVVK